MGSQASRKGRKLPGLKAVREERFVTQAELARKAGVTQATVWELESGGSERGAYVTTIRKLAEALGVEPSVLVKAPDTEKEPILH
ncbi:MAG: helix-turn-helix domain-containing protein [Actinomycetota bacterium]|nr:helix-turn-helix domain-containing protein [Actinomycetota bacterium]